MAHDEAQIVAAFDVDEPGKAIKNLRPMAVGIPFGRGTVLVAVVRVEFKPDPLRHPRANAGARRGDREWAASHRVGGALHLETQKFEIVREHLMGYRVENDGKIRRREIVERRKIESVGAP